MIVYRRFVELSANKIRDFAVTLADGVSHVFLQETFLRFVFFPDIFDVQHEAVVFSILNFLIANDWKCKAVCTIAM